MQRRASDWISQGFETLVSKIKTASPSAQDDPFHFDIVIVGSGYGGAIAASQLAGLRQTANDLQQARQQQAKPNRPLKICVLERGNEYLAGMFPSRMADLPEHVRFSTPDKATPSGNRDGLFDIRISPHLNTVLANGLGGGSLINAGVMIEPKPEVFNDRWPTALRNHPEQELFARYYPQAKRLLGASDDSGDNTIARHQAHQQQPLAKHRQLHLLATDRTTHGKKTSPSGCSTCPTSSYDAAITVAMEDKINSGGVQLNACNLCGDCATGCNHNAKDSLDTNLLVQAWQQGVELYTGATVLKLLPCEPNPQALPQNHSPAGWTLLVAHTKAKLRKQQGKPLKLTAAKVILAAGSLGSTEILLRSQSAQFPLSRRLGQSFSSNGDMLATVFHQHNPVHAIANENDQPGNRHIGPTITGVIDLRDTPQSLLIEEMAVPGALRRLYEELVTTTDSLASLMTTDTSPHQQGQPENDPYNVDAQKIDRTAIYAIMGDDGSQGSLELVTDQPPSRTGSSDNINHQVSEGARDMSGDGSIRVRWSGLPDNPLFVEQVQVLESLVEKSAIGGRAQGNPAWRPLPESMAHLLGGGKGPQLTVHPLGGCGMADSADCGVVDQFGRVFNPANLSQPGAVYDNLVVLDGAMIPCALGANPALTIAAISLRALRELGRHWGFVTAAPDRTAEQGADNLAQQAAAQRSHHAAPSSDHPQQPAIRASKAAPKTAIDSPEPLSPPFTRPRFADKSFVPPTKATTVEITERISGRVTLTDHHAQPLDCMVDITLRFTPKPVLDFVHGTDRTLRVNNALEPDEPVSQLRIFERRQWQTLIREGASDERFTQHALFVAPVQGTLEIMGRQASSAPQRIRRTLWPWLRNRGLRDAWQALEEWLRQKRLPVKIKPAAANTRNPLRAASRALKNLKKTANGKYHEIKALASHGGEVRLFDYQLSVERPAQGWPDALAGFDKQASRVNIQGCKTISYTRAANPMRQFEDMYIHVFPGLQPRRRQPKKRTPYLRFDSRFLSHYNKPLIRITEQQDQVTALADMAAFMAYFARVLINIHLWSFRKPDTQRPGTPTRLPGRIRGIAQPDIIELPVGQHDTGLAVELPVKVRLTRYPQPHSSAPPVLLIHGYSASGNTYTHPSIDPNLTHYLWMKGRDVWVVDLRTSSGMPTAMLPWSFEDVAFADIPVAIDHICQTTQQEKVDVVAHCMGSAMFSMAVLAPPENDAPFFRERQLLPQRIGKAVLSQVGPRVVFSPENIFRAYGLSYVQQLMPFVFYAFKRSDAPGTAEQLLDRLLSALPYPDGEFDLENPGLPWAKTPFVGTRHRMDGLYGRTFSLANLSRKTLDSIDDLFGPLSMVTLSQVIRFAIHERVTNKHGENEFVTHERLKQFWTFPTLSVHGDENGLADISTLGRMTETMHKAGCDYRTEVLAGFGHQDALIGKGVRANFDKIHRFLQQGPPPSTAPAPHEPEAQHYQLHLPFSGPVIGAIQAGESNTLPVSLGFSSQKMNPEFVLFIAVKYHRQGLRLASSVHGPTLSLNLMRENLCVKFASPHQDRWLKTELPVTPTFEQADGILSLLLDDLDLDSNQALYGQLYDAVLPDNLLDIIDLPSIASDPQHRALSDYLQQHLLSDNFARALNNVLQQPLTELENAIVELPSPPAGPGLGEQTPTTQFVLAACQYAPGMLDRKVAYRAYRRLSARLDACGASATAQTPQSQVTASGTSTELKPQFIVLAGDQVYTDASAGLFDPIDRYDRFTATYHKWLHQRPVKSVLRRLPSFMMLDDHELKNDWDQSESELGEKALLADGKRAYLNFQRNLHQTPNIQDLEKTPLWYTFTQQGLDFFMVDSRTERQGRKISARDNERPEKAIADLNSAQLMSDEQLRALKDWLLNAPGDGRPRFILSPSMLLPRRLRSTAGTTASGAHPGSIHSDAWDGYPSTLHDLLHFIAEHNLTNLVFLSGDEHLSSTVDIDLTHAGHNTRTRVHSIHSSGLYSPFTFVNSTPDLFAGHESFQVPGDSDLQCEVKTRFYPGDGFALLTVAQENQRWVLQCEFDRVPDRADEASTTEAASGENRLRQRWEMVREQSLSTS
ncbi:alpha/beta fold hydrolase [Aestuariicella hydrocarbonica]|uniref:Cholesterol oxidase n=1 Tax=Pseudomaricurvus hydrocarbonicus TaxID=1470433 RepID=A0A9E5JT79_9GAMM|nr:alpha/beta fold hydrolase [Aestuariicella hydrocarbonica]NHO64879.1 alpha/beta fold hydrolase [Aestuariicella hydrocarbonica]